MMLTTSPLASKIASRCTDTRPPASDLRGCRKTLLEQPANFHHQLPLAVWTASTVNISPSGAFSRARQPVLSTRQAPLSHERETDARVRQTQT